MLALRGKSWRCNTTLISGRIDAVYLFLFHYFLAIRRNRSKSLPEIGRFLCIVDVVTVVTSTPFWTLNSLELSGLKKMLFSQFIKPHEPKWNIFRRFELILNFTGHPRVATFLGNFQRVFNWKIQNQNEKKNCRYIQIKMQTNKFFTWNVNKQKFHNLIFS
jgi:hypothetical protein